MKISCFWRNVKSKAGQLLSNCLIFGQNLGWRLSNRVAYKKKKCIKFLCSSATTALLKYGDPGVEKPAPTVGVIKIPRSTFRNVTNFEGKINIVTYRKPTLFQNIETEERTKQKVGRFFLFLLFLIYWKLPLNCQRQVESEKDNCFCIYYKILFSHINLSLTRIVLIDARSFCLYTKGLFGMFAYRYTPTGNRRRVL